VTQPTTTTHEKVYMPLPSPAALMPLLARITAWIMTLSVGDNYIPKADDCITTTGSGCFSIFINGNLARVLLASYKITGNKDHLNEGLRWCDTFVKLQHEGLSYDGKESVGWWDTGYDELYIADTGTAVTTLALCSDLVDGQSSRRSAYTSALQKFDRFIRKGINKTPQCTPILPGKSSCSYDGNFSETSAGWIAGADAGDDVGGLGDGYYKGRLNLPPYTISTALSGGVFYSELYAISNASAADRAVYESVARGAVSWLLRKKLANGTIPYIIYPPTSVPHEYQSITYSAEAFIDLHLRFGSAATPMLKGLENTIGFLLAKQGPSGALLPNGTSGEIYRSARAASLMQWWYMNVEPSSEKVASAISRYVVDWLQSEEGSATEGVASRALPSGFIGLVAADLIQPWATFVKGRWPALHA
jgi:hypothetical protein